jgi:hypothetical protein
MKTEKLWSTGMSFKSFLNYKNITTQYSNRSGDGIILMNEKKPEKMAFDIKWMAYGGSKVIISSHKN